MTTIAFDLDGTLCTVAENYDDAEPISSRIQKVNELYRSGVVVLIFTARGASSGLDYKELTLSQLKSWGVCFHELILGKPHYDLLVDDKVVLANDYFSD